MEIGKRVRHGLRITPIGRIVDRLFGYDFFIAYSHSDGQEYGRGLEQKLGREYRVFLDEKAFGASDHLPSQDTREVRRSRFMILVASPKAFESKWVKYEVVTFWAKNKSRLIPINFGDLLLSDEGRVFDEGIPDFKITDVLFVDEEANGWEKAPTGNAIQEIRDAFTGMQRRTFRNLCVACFLALLVFVLGYGWYESNRSTVAAQFNDARSRLSVGAHFMGRGQLGEATSRYFHGYDSFPVAWRRNLATPMKRPVSYREERDAALSMIGACNPFGGVERVLPHVVSDSNDPIKVIWIRFNRKGDRLATVDLTGYIRVWDWNRSKLLLRPWRPENLPRIKSVYFSTENDDLVMTHHGGSDSEEVHWWDISTGTPVEVEGGDNEYVPFGELSCHGEFSIGPGKPGQTFLPILRAGENSELSALPTLQHENPAEWGIFSYNGNWGVSWTDEDQKKRGLICLGYAKTWPTGRKCGENRHSPRIQGRCHFRPDQ